MDTIRTLEDLLVALQDTQSRFQTEKDASKPFNQGKIEGLQIAIMMVRVTIRDEVREEKKENSSKDI
jgi:hypothetical protein